MKKGGRGIFIKPITIIGVGNLLMRDEGVGIHSIKYLQQFDWPSNVELIDAGVPSASLIHILEGRELSIIIDCADFKGKPGELLVVDAEKLKRPDEHIISLHGTSLLGTIELASKTGIEIGKIILICVQPKEIEIGDKLSEEVSKSLPKIHVIARRVATKQSRN